MKQNHLIETRLITNNLDFQIAKKIRYDVFVVEQKVAEEEEFDEFEITSRHILAFNKTEPVGTARWRKTEKGIKLERFAVINSARSQGVGSALVRGILADIQSNIDHDTFLYLHAQLSAVNLYAKFGFQKVGKIFEECDIQHYKMEKMQFYENSI